MSRPASDRLTLPPSAIARVREDGVWLLDHPFPPPPDPPPPTRRGISSRFRRIRPYPLHR
jgi:hypothetical protein